MPKESYYLPQRRLISQDDAAIVQAADVPRSRFLNLSSRITAFDAGYLVPIVCDEVLPGDHFTYHVTPYVRLSTPLFPLYSNQRVDTQFFFCPNRLAWTNWTKMMGEQLTPASSINFGTPQTTVPVGGAPVGSLHDHFDIPGLGQIDPLFSFTVNALPFRMYHIIWNEWYRDQNSINGVNVPLGDGPEAWAGALLRRAKSHDYFTAALPWPQKFTAPTVPLGGMAPIVGIGAIGAPTGAATNWMETGGASPLYGNWTSAFTAAAGNDFAIKTTGTGEPQIFADLSLATGVAINTLRQAWMVQSLLERDARGGTRYVELIWNHFRVRNPDYRLQRPEYIGGGQSPLIITPVAQTAPAVGSTVGALGAAGTATGSHAASYAATEHGFIIGLISVRSELAYQQGLHRQWTRSTRFDYYWPSLAMLGEQAVLRKELYCTGDPANDNVVFGYQERWHEYRTSHSSITGVMRSTAAGTLDAWHLAQRFTAAPVLGATFLEDTPPMSRVLAAGGLSAGQQYIADIVIQRTMVRPIPTFGTPATLGRF